MTIYHFGTSVDGSVFVEQVPSTPPTDAAATGAPLRPGRGLHLRVRNPQFGTDLPDIVTGDFGYWDYTTEDIPVIWVSSDNFVTKVSIRATEAMDSAATSGVDATNALLLASNANDTANQALLVAQQNTGGGNIESVNGQTGSVILTAADVQARPSATPVPATDVSGLATVAKTGAYADLTGKPVTAIAATEKGTANGVAPLDSALKVPLANMTSFMKPWNNPATRPTTDTTIGVIWFTSTAPTAAMGPFDTWINIS